MNHKLSFLPLILLLFTACGEVNSDNKNSDISMVCQDNQNKNKLFNQKIPKIEPFNDIKILVKNTLFSTQKNLAFDKKGIYDLFTTEYYWASLVSKNFNYAPYTNPQNLIDALKNQKDRWSFAVTIEDYKNATSQKSVGVGVICQDFETGCLVTFVRLDSPADKIDLRRGDIIEKVNGIKATESLFYKEAKKEKELKLEIRRANANQICKGSVTPREYNYKVAQGKILKTSKQEKVAYFRLDSFLGGRSIENQINTLFNNFKKNNIEKLIVDLRYNGGGSVDIASEVLNKFVKNKEKDTQFRLTWNKEYQKNNDLYTFKTTANSLDLKQIIFLTTQNSASASELIISAMKPYLSEENLVIIGDKTDGKPVGMSGRSDGNYYYLLINFVVQNSLGFYDYFEGLPVTSGCQIADDPFHEMGDVNEAMLKSALQYIDTGSCQ